MTDCVGLTCALKTEQEPWTPTNSAPPLLLLVVREPPQKKQSFHLCTPKMTLPRNILWCVPMPIAQLWSPNGLWIPSTLPTSTTTCHHQTFEMQMNLKIFVTKTKVSLSALLLCPFCILEIPTRFCPVKLSKRLWTSTRTSGRPTLTTVTPSLRMTQGFVVCDPATRQSQQDV